jgi:hypothetical protein
VLNSRWFVTTAIFLNGFFTKIYPKKVCMGKKLSKIIGLNLQKFDEIVGKRDEFHMQKARLLPFYKAGDEK